MTRMVKLASLFGIIALVVVMTLTFALGQQSPTAASPEKSSGKGGIDSAIVLFVGSPLALVNNAETRIDTGNPDVMPVIKNNRTLAPVRFVAEKLGLDVQWNSGTSEVTISQKDKNIKMVLGSSTMQVGDRAVKLEAAAEAINGRTFIPLRALAEAVGKKVFYDRGLIIISDEENIFDAAADKAILDGIIASVNKPPVIGSAEALKSLLNRLYTEGGVSYDTGNIRTLRGNAVAGELTEDKAQAPAAANEKQKLAEAPKAPSAGADYSGTNVQVQGVDEADVVKTDGEYIYQVNNQKIIVAKAYPAENMEIASSISFEGKNFIPAELYIDAKRMVVIGNSYAAAVITPAVEPKVKILPDRYPPVFQENTAKAIIFDISDKKNIKQLREVELEGNYVSSRKIGGTLYLVSNKNIWRWVVPQNFEKEGLEKAVPSYRDTAESSEFIPLDYSKMYFFPDSLQANYMTVAAVNLDKDGEKANISSYLGAGQNIYASTQNLYIAVDAYTARNTIMEKKIAPIPASSPNSTVYKFSLNAGSFTYLCKGEVPGTILDQFSMDENGKNFRIATTKGDTWRTDEFTSKNNVYILDELLNITGRLENIAPGEKIYSVRFMGDRAYVVTFKTIDPLFVIDLKDPAAPKVLGALKIPGYSDYLHPYDENHIIGFGKDTVEVKGNAYYLGMKLALFDVSDVANPKELFSEKIGDRGTDSELLQNHKALLFSREKNLLAFPVTLMEIKNSSEKLKEGFPQYGQFTFQGAYVYDIDLAKGFKLKGRISHISNEEYAKSGEQWYGSDKNVERILYIDDTLYTLSKGMIKANDMNSLKEKNSLPVK